MRALLDELLDDVWETLSWAEQGNWSREELQAELEALLNDADTRLERIDILGPIAAEARP